MSHSPTREKVDFTLLKALKQRPARLVGKPSRHHATMAEKQPLTNGSYGATTKPATPTGAHSMDLLRTSSSKNPINTSSNVLLLYRMNELQHLGRVNFGLAVGTLLYLATNVVLFTFNAMCAAASESPVPSLVEAPRVGAMAWRGYAIDATPTQGPQRRRVRRPRRHQVRALRVARFSAPVPHLRVLGRVPVRVHRGDVVDLHAASPCYRL